MRNERLSRITERRNLCMHLRTLEIITNDGNLHVSPWKNLWQPHGGAFAFGRRLSYLASVPIFGDVVKLTYTKRFFDVCIFQHDKFNDICLSMSMDVFFFQSVRRLRIKSVFGTGYSRKMSRKGKHWHLSSLWVVLKNLTNVTHIFFTLNYKTSIS